MNNDTVSEFVDYQEGNMIVDLFITEPEDIPLLKANIKHLNMGALLKVEETNGGYNVQVLIPSATQLYLLGRYVGCDRKRLHDLDF